MYYCFGCGAGGEKTPSTADDAAAAGAPGELNRYSEASGSDIDAAEAEEPSAEFSSGGGIAGEGTDNSALDAGQLDTDKIIYSAYAEIETVDFDESLKALDQMIGRLGAFVESSAVTGNNYGYGGRSARSAEYTVRVPRECFEEMTGSLSTLGNVPYSSTKSDNITPRYTDTESRLKAYRIEEERLLAMLEKTATVEEMLSIEDRLTEVRYNIESLTSAIQGWDSLIRYSTVSLRIYEVAEYTEEVPAQRGYWQQVGDALRGSLEGLGRFFQWLLKALIAALPVLIVLSAVIVPVALLIRRRSRRLSRSRQLPSAGLPPQDETDETK
jgi:hypothetical protein